MSDTYQDGVRLLARRSLTRHEVVQKLRALGHGDDEVEDAVSRLTAMSAIDDAALARRFIEERSATRGRGHERVLAELRARGVDPLVAASAWSQAVSEGAIDGGAVLARAVRSRLGPAPARAGQARLARVYNALLHEGFEPKEVEEALAPYGFERIDA
jgi:regulatory protein